jgi:hypothetical protein
MNSEAISSISDFITSAWHFQTHQAPEALFKDLRAVSLSESAVFPNSGLLRGSIRFKKLRNERGYLLGVVLALFVMMYLNDDPLEE